MSGCRIAGGFPTAMHAANAAKEMNEVADWLGILKTRAEGGRPNCQGELARIAEGYGGQLGGGAGVNTQEACARAVATAEAAR